ncbi:unnamed protein product [Urochloa decumbens]|uniref:Disease resistance protein At4g27190-like leucine-rich repeats domain-containing protein n=1 Tax=Urochloa decumbens TaxID=240449 RepID=A0ABC9A0A3_9POAL
MSDARDVNSARETILKCIRRNRDKKVIYFNGWSSFGEAPVLRSIAQELRTIKAKKTPLELCFDIIIYIDCSAWKNRREMQKKIAEELELDIETMAMFDKQDEEDDFNGVDQDSRDVLRSVSTAIDQKLGHRKFIMIFLNGGKDAVDVSRFGINPEYRDHTIIWTFNRLYLTIREDHLEINRKLRYTDIFVFVSRPANGLTSSEFCAVLREVAANIVARHPCMQNINLTMVMECCLYELFVQYSFHRATRFAWAAHAPNYWMCDGIIKENGKKEICRSTLHQEIHWECDAHRLDLVFEMLMEDPAAPFFIVKGDDISFLERRPCRWICVTSKDLIRIHADIKTRFETASSLFVALEKCAKPPCLPNGFLKHCSNLGVLALSYCAFSFVSPPFLCCHKLRFLGLDHCSHDNTSEGEDNRNWKCLQNLWVLDLRYTEWDDILSKEKMNIMVNLREVNIEGYMCWQLIAIFHRRLPYLQRLRIIKPTHKAKTSTESSNSFMVKTELEILDLSGNRDMEKLSISSSMARSLLVLILDGCDGLDDVVVPDGLLSSLTLFSFDGYGPAARWMSSFELPLQSSERERPPDADKWVVETSKISLQGCTQLENLFVRGLPNLVELDLSGSAIKVLDLTTMVVDVPGLKRLFLLGCEHLSAIKWGSYGSMIQLNLELLCIDTRHRRVPGFTRPSLAQHKSFSLQLHATLADARLTSTLFELINHYQDRLHNFLHYVGIYYDKGVYFNIQITSSIEYGGEMIQIQPSNQQHHVLVRGYGDVFSKIGDAPMLVFPQPPTQRLDRHIEIGSGSRGLESALAKYNSLYGLMEWHVESLHMHDASTSASMPTGSLTCLKWTRVESCPRIETVFPSGPTNCANMLETIWASDLQMARCIWSKGAQSIPSFKKLQHLHLHSCPRLQFVLPVWVASFPSLETLHINRCGDLTHVFVLDGRYPQKIVTYGVPFPKLTTIHFHDLPKLQRIMCEVKMLAPALETIMIRGCFALRQLPSLQGRRRGAKRPTVEMEKDVWDALEWDGLAAGHHPDLFEPPVHSRYYRRRRLLRGTVLR